MSTNHNSVLHKPCQNGKSQEVVCVEMCFFCFDVLVNHLNHVPPPKNPCFTNDRFPLFVTWNTGKDNLRGCIGTFKAINLHFGLKKYALKSANEDERFNPINRDELDSLYVSVSILTNFEKINDYVDWVVGLHGIKIEWFDELGEAKSATYLPEVAAERGWNHTQTIDSLLRKGGYRNIITAQVRQSLNITRYRSEKLTVSYDDYQDWRNRLATKA